MPLPPAKKRRIEAAKSALNKPFRSPLKTPLQSKSNPPATSNLSPTAAQDETTSPTKNPTLETSATTNTSTNARPKPSRAASSKAFAPQRRYPAPTRNPPTTNPTLLAARRRLATLEAQHRAITADTALIQQAGSILARDSVPELAALREKWKGVARQAAEEVFVGVKEWVEHMGGVRVWREEERRRRRERERYAWGGEELGGGRGGGDGGGGDEEGEGEDGEELGRRAERGARREELEGARGVDEVDEVENGVEGEVDDPVMDQEGDDDTFTMDIMLRSLHIDLALIGYDREQQRWID
ncbi:hypothetical protein EV356DRAFT_531393 [Viridothelium virens]|uniref:Swi5-domain-containing protein n=1 Tax=Viridothelium virens TaxID=1048519 RepID=A0A6A6HE81_VIRVR|nr:hypothetical protein EV356DRAFT_531393 [Viridothelium virens]